MTVDASRAFAVWQICERIRLSRADPDYNS
jgi:hypothetical protein